KKNILDYKSGQVTAEVQGDAVKMSMAFTKTSGKLDEPVVNAGLMPDANTLVAVFNGSGEEAVGTVSPAGMTMTGGIFDSDDPGLPGRRRASRGSLGGHRGGRGLLRV